MAELLLELFSEEIPARMQAKAAADLKRLVTDGLEGASLEFSSAEAFVTPRRLTLVVEGLPEKQPDVRDEKRGPKVDAPDKAIEGFLKANGLTRDACEERETPKGTFLFAVVEKTGEETRTVLPALLADAIRGLPWPKSMRWGTGSFRWVRSLQNILCLFDGVSLDVGLDPAIPTEATTRGHRFHAPDALGISGFADYREKLSAAHVVLDREDRKQIIGEGAEKLATDDGLVLRDDPALLDEVAGLVEWPVVLMGRIDEAFMDVPPEVLITSMRSHQKYFAVETADGALAPRFVVVANLEAADGGAAIVAGNERVLRARLSDAKFFWDQDRKRSLESRVPALSDIVFHARLGTLAERVSRIQALAAEIAQKTGADVDAVRSAATLCKADLVTDMVGEFPDLQGLMGQYYALQEGEKSDVAQAIEEHYSPQGPGDVCPTAPVSVAVALAEKIDTLVGFFAIDEKPTGSKDPFALRRAAIGIIRLILENKLRLPLRDVFQTAYWGYNESVSGFEKELADGHQPKIVVADLMAFIADRLKVHLRDQGVRHDLITAVFALGGEDDLVRLLSRVDALAGFVGSDDGANLLTAYRRAANIVEIEEKKDGSEYRDAPASDLLKEDAERALFEALSTLEADLSPALENERFDEAMKRLAGLRAPVDAFFDDVTVNADDAKLRTNRLRMLSQIRFTMGRIADFSQIEGVGT